MKMYKNLLYSLILFLVNSCDISESKQELISVNEQSLGKSGSKKYNTNNQKNKSDYNGGKRGNKKNKRGREKNSHTNYQRNKFSSNGNKNGKQEVEIINSVIRIPWSTDKDEPQEQQVENKNNFKTRLYKWVIDNKKYIIKQLRVKYSNKSLKDNCLFTYACDLIECVCKDIEFVKNGNKLKLLPYENVIANPGWLCALLSVVNGDWRNEVYVGLFNESFSNRSDRAERDIKINKMDWSTFENFEYLHAMKILVEWNNELVAAEGKNFSRNDRMKIIEKYIFTKIWEDHKCLCEDDFYEKYGCKEKYDNYDEVNKLPLFDFIKKDYKKLCVPNHMYRVYKLFVQLLNNIDDGCVHYGTSDILPNNLKYNKKKELYNSLFSKCKYKIVYLNLFQCKSLFKQMAVVEEMYKKGFSLKSLSVFLDEDDFDEHCYCYVGGEDKVTFYSDYVENTYDNCLYEISATPYCFCFVKDKNETLYKKWMDLFRTWKHQVRLLFESSFENQKQFEKMLDSFNLIVQQREDIDPKFWEMLFFVKDELLKATKCYKFSGKAACFLPYKFFYECCLNSSSEIMKVLGNIPYGSTKLTEDEKSLIKEYLNRICYRIDFEKYKGYLHEYLYIRNTNVIFEKYPGNGVYPYGILNRDNKIVPTDSCYKVVDKTLKFNGNNGILKTCIMDSKNFDLSNWHYWFGDVENQNIESIQINQTVNHGFLGYLDKGKDFKDTGKFIKIFQKNGIEQHIMSNKGNFLVKILKLPKNGLYIFNNPDSLVSHEKFSLFRKVAENILGIPKLKLQSGEGYTINEKVMWGMLKGEKPTYRDELIYGWLGECKIQQELDRNIIVSNDKINRIYVNENGILNGSFDKIVRSGNSIMTIRTCFSCDDNKTCSKNKMSKFYYGKDRLQIDYEFDDQQRVIKEFYKKNNNNAGHIYIQYGDEYMIKYESLYWAYELDNYSKPIYCYSFLVCKKPNNPSEAECTIKYEQKNKNKEYSYSLKTYDVFTSDIIQYDTILPEKLYNKRISGIIRAIRSYEWKRPTFFKKSSIYNGIDSATICTIQTNNNAESDELIKNKYFLLENGPKKTKNGEMDFFEKRFFLPQWCSNLTYQEANSFSICPSNVQSNVHIGKGGDLMEIE